MKISISIKGGHRFRHLTSSEQASIDGMSSSNVASALSYDPEMKYARAGNHR